MLSYHKERYIKYNLCFANPFSEKAKPAGYAKCSYIRRLAYRIKIIPVLFHQD
ncbi:hypothetical protein HMPREF9554_01809 [Treponema phagedenis F0421]|nr:hypothetical protein HMPREF9554_01809 [Treponema phagedenis F0421]